MAKKSLIVKIAIIIVVISIGLGSCTKSSPAGGSGSVSTIPENKLLSQKIIEEPVMNGTGDKRIGTRAYIKLSTKDLSEATLEQITAFYKSFKDKKYNWVSVICEDGSGLIFSGNTGMASYTNSLDDDGSHSSGDTSKVIFYDDVKDTFVIIE
jgi:hypothetical protein